MGFRLWPAALAFALVLVAFAGCAKKEEPKTAAPPAPPAASAAAEGKVLFEQKCSVCHGLDRVTARVESKEKWNEIIKGMQSKKADWITDAEAAKILEYLTAERGRR